MLATCFANLANLEVKSIEFSDIMALSWRSTCVKILVSNYLKIIVLFLTSLTVDIVEL